MSDDHEDSVPASGLFIPLILVECSLVLTLIWQCTFISEQRKILHNTEQQIAAAAATTAPQQEQQVRASAEVQAKLKSLATDLLDLAKTDADAKAIVEQFQIARQEPASP